MTERHTDIVALLPRLRRYARVLTGSAEAADDLVQDCVERALSRLHLWQEGTNLRAWLFTVMHNLHVNQVRQAKRRREEALDHGPEGARVTPRALVEAPRQDDVVELRTVATMLRQLPAEQREVLVLVCVEELSYREAAEVLAVPIGTVMSRLARARERLRTLGQSPARAAP